MSSTPTEARTTVRPRGKLKELRRLSALYVATLVVALIACAVIEGTLDIGSWLSASVAAAFALLILTSVAMLEYRPRKAPTEETSS